MTKYNEDIKKEIAGYIREGMTISEATKRAGISHETFNVWKKEKTDFSESIKNAIRERNEEAFELARNNSTRIVGTLVDLATGQAKRVKTVTKYAPDPHGKPVIVEKTEQEDTVVNPVAAIFLLTNIDPEHWKNRQESKQELSGNVGGLNIIVKNDDEADLIRQLKDK